MEAVEFPEGTPEYEEYRAVLRAELAKFAAGEAPYEYDRDPLITGKPWPTGEGHRGCTPRKG